MKPTAKQQRLFITRHEPVDNNGAECPQTASFVPTGWPIESDWTPRLSAHFETDQFQQLEAFVAQQRRTETVFPPADQVYNAFRWTPFAATKVVVLGQDPYHGAGQAHGLSFSVAGETRLPPSLKNIFRELVQDTECEMPVHGNLLAWARQGVLLLNTVLTVREGEANSHRNQGWELFTDEVMNQLNSHPQKLVFVLWGKPAEKKLKLIDTRHETIVSAHPSPLSARRGFFGSRPFTQVNAFLKNNARQPVDWGLPR